MAYLSQDALENLGFAALGANVLISDKAAIYDAHEITIGNNCRIDDFCVVSGRLEIGRNVYFGPHGLVAGGSPGIVFGDFATFAYRVQIFTQSDDYGGATMTNPTVPARYKLETKQHIQIGKHVIIGAGATVMPGVYLQEGTAIGAASLVLKSTEAWSIYTGAPARKIRNRDRGLLAMEQKLLDEERQAAENDTGQLR